MGLANAQHVSSVLPTMLFFLAAAACLHSPCGAHFERVSALAESILLSVENGAVALTRELIV